jgi:hypothetical protein
MQRRRHSHRHSIPERSASCRNESRFLAISGTSSEATPETRPARIRGKSDVVKHVVRSGNASARQYVECIRTSLGAEVSDDVGVVERCHQLYLFLEKRQMRKYSGESEITPLIVRFHGVQ